MHSAYLSSNSRNWETNKRRKKTDNFFVRLVPWFKAIISRRDLYRKSRLWRKGVERLTSAVSCRWASFAAPKCWVSSSFSKACWEHSRTYCISLYKGHNGDKMFSLCTVLTETNGFIPAWPSSGGRLFARGGAWSPPAAGRHRRSSGPVLQTELWFEGWNCLEWGKGSESDQKICFLSTESGSNGCFAATYAVLWRSHWQAAAPFPHRTLSLFPGDSPDRNGINYYDTPYDVNN